MAIHPQLPLAMEVREGNHFDNFINGENEQVVTLLKRQAQELDEPLVYLWGEQGSGCSHLLEATCQWSASHDNTAMYLPLDVLVELDVSVLEGIESVDLICIDHLNALAGRPHWQEALFHLFNRVYPTDTCLLLAGQQKPANLPITLPDLVSRLSQCTQYCIAPLSDAHKQELLKRRAKRQGLELSDEVARYLLQRGDRHLTSQLAYLEQLDRQSLSSRRRLTVPFVKQVLGW